MKIEAIWRHGDAGSQCRITASPRLRVESDDTPQVATGWWRLLRNRSLICLTISYGAVGYLEYLFFYWMNHYFVQVRHLDPKDSRFYSSIPPAVMVVGMLLGGWISDLMVR